MRFAHHLRFPLLLVTVWMLASCGPYHRRSYAPDPKIRADYLVKTVRARFEITPTCHTRSILLLYLSRNCRDPYYLTVHFTSFRKSQDSNVVQFNSLVFSADGRNHELLNPGETDRLLILEPQSDGSYSTAMTFNLGRRLAPNGSGLKATLDYKFQDQERFTRVEKGFDTKNKRGITTIFHRQHGTRKDLPGVSVRPGYQPIR